MEKFEISILGCGCAVPTMRHNPAAQIVNFRHKLFMIDCGEGTQLQYRRRRLPFARLQAVFISHLHGDHCLGLVGMISTFALLGRTAPCTFMLRQSLSRYCRIKLISLSESRPLKCLFIQ